MNNKINEEIIKLINNHLTFYTHTELLNNYNKINDTILNKIFDEYKVNVIPKDITDIINKRTNNFFVHNIEEIKKNYIKQMPYYNEEGLLCKSSSKIKEKLLSKETTMYEKDLCKEIWFASYYGKVNYPFDIIDIQTPLKMSRNDKYGEIDLVGTSINNNLATIHLIETKPLTTIETLLRATIEAITYKYIIDINKTKFIKDFENYIMKYNGMGSNALKIKKLLYKDIKLNYDIVISVLVPKKLYKDNYSRKIYENFYNDLEYYIIDYNKNDIEYYTKNCRKESLFLDNCYPIIKKTNYEE